MSLDAARADETRDVDARRTNAIPSCPETPAFIIDERSIVERLALVDRVKRECGCKFLYTMKPLADASVMRLMASHVDGFAAASLFEARLARDVLGDRGTVHMTTPGFRPGDIGDLAALCDYMSLNSLSQLDRFGPLLCPETRLGLRVNPSLSFADDERYDPCRPASKLGVPLADLIEAAASRDLLQAGVSGLHVHNNCDSTTFDPLKTTVERLMTALPNLLRRVEWVNLGGGYLFGPAEDLPPFYEAVDLIRDAYGVEVFVEPGAALVREAGYLVSSVIDLFESGDATVAVLDTTVNHMPEVYEYGFEPDVLGHEDDAEFCYTLAGASCLAGDVFGEYEFAEPLEIGSRVLFYNVGAYTMVKAHMFNGINLPTLYRISPLGELLLAKRFTFTDFLNRIGE